MALINHKEREHAKFSASGSERWLKCPPSVELEESCPESPDTPWSKEGTYAHECLEKELLGEPYKPLDSEMKRHVLATAKLLRFMARGHKLLIEKRVYNNDIDPEMFGTCDNIIPEYFVRLNIIDFKYGTSIVEAKDNTQLIQYALAVAESYDWNAKLFPKIKMHILQPRAGKNWHKSWEITMQELVEKWLPLWHKGVARVHNKTGRFFEGSHCHWCRAKDTKCPLKRAKKSEKVVSRFTKLTPEKDEVSNGFKEKVSYQEKVAIKKGYYSQKKNPFK